MKKLLSIIVTITLLLNLIAVSILSATANESTANKICDYIDTYTESELAELTADPDDYYVSVFVNFSYPKMNTWELRDFEKATRVSLIKIYYHTRNIIIAENLGIPMDAISAYTPYAELSYDSVAAYEADKSFVYGLADSASVSLVEISIRKSETFGEQSTGTNSIEYDTTRIFADVGITDHTYMGETINLGFLEKSILIGSHDLSEDMLTQNGAALYTEEYLHTRQVVFTAMCDSGIAYDAHCYVSSLANTTWRSALEWLINNNVDLINISVGDRSVGGQYNQLSAYIDYLIDSTDTLVITASGLGDFETNDNFAGENETEEFLYNIPAVCSNALTVSAVKPDKTVAYVSNVDLNADGIYDPPQIGAGLAKPDLVAPGYNLKLNNVTMHGSSYAAAIVSGIAARLLQQFPSLKNNAHLLKAVLTASCVKLPTQVQSQDPYAGAGMINYNNARSIMQNQQYEIFYKPYDESDGAYIGCFETSEVPAGSSVTIRYVIPVSGCVYATPNGSTSVALEPFSTFECTMIGSSLSGSYTTVAERTTGVITCPINANADMICSVDVYLNENNSDTEIEEFIIAYLVS